MIPKVETCIYALDAGVEGVVILDGRFRTRCCSSCSPTTAPAR
jgi:acetylglutamate kinase